MFTFTPDDASWRASIETLQDFADVLHGDKGRIYERFSEIMQNSIEQNFEARGRPSWPPRKREYPWPILVKSGDLISSAKDSAAPSSWKHGEKEHTLEIKTVFYGYFHQYASGLNVQYPERKFVVMQPQDIAEMEKSAAEELKKI